MSTLEQWQTLIGSWTGMNRLYLPEEPIRESSSAASVALAVKGKFCTITYTWAYDGQPQEGMLLCGYDPDRGTVNVVFVDSWHMGDKLMLLQGSDAGQAAINVLGSYAVEASPDWGWRIVIEPGANEWRLLMYNVSPDGEEYLGVEATYTRMS